MFERISARVDKLKINQEKKRDAGKSLNISEAQELYDTETLRDIGDAAQLEGADPNKVLGQLAKESGEGKWISRYSRYF